MQKKKAERIYRMSEQFDDWDGVDATELYGIGKYGSTVTDCFTKTRYQPTLVIMNYKDILMRSLNND